jgi:hypothetical protein
VLVIAYQIDLYLITQLVINKIKLYPSTFVRSRKAKKIVFDYMDAQYPEGFSAMDLPIYDLPGSFWIISPSDAPEAKRVGHPPFLAARFSHVITARGHA